MAVATAANVKAGGAYVELFTKDDKLDRGLKGGASKVKMWAEAVKKAASPEMLSGALGGGAMGIVAALGGATVKAVFSDFILNQRTIGHEIERNSELSSRWLENFQSGLEKVRQRVAEFQSAIGTGGGLTKLESEIEAAEKNLGGLEKSLGKTREAFEEYDHIFQGHDFADAMKNYALFLSAPVTGGLEGEQAKLKPALDEANKAYLDQLKLVTELKRQRNELLDPSKNPKAIKSITDFTDGIKAEVDKLTSVVSDRQRALQKIADQFGFGPSNSEFQQATEAVRKADVAEAIESFVKAVNDQTRRIENSHLDDDEFKFMEMAQKNDWGPANPEWQRGMEALKNKRIAEAVDAAEHMFDDPEVISKAVSGSRGATQFASGAQFFGVAGAGGGVFEKQLKAEERTNQLLEGVTDILKQADGLVIA